MFPEEQRSDDESIPGDFYSGIKTFYSFYTIGHKFQTVDPSPDTKQMQGTTWLLIPAYELLFLAADIVFRAAEVEK